MKKYLIGVLLLFLGGCTIRPTLETPTGLSIEDQTLIWNEVEGATLYVLDINGNDFFSTTTSFSMSEFENGDYTVSICAVSTEYNDSSYSEPIQFYLIAQMSLPQNVAINEMLLSWNAVDHAQYYQVYINDLVFTTSNLTYDLSELDENHVYMISISAHYNTLESLTTIQLKYHTYFQNYDAFDETFYKSSTDDFVIVFEDEDITIDEVFYESETLSSTEYLFDNQTFSFTNAFMQALNYGEHQFLIWTNKGNVILEVDVLDDRSPYMISNNNIYFTDQDLELTFMLYDGVILSLSGNDITADDYQIDDNTIIIDIDYVQGKFDENPSRTTLILGYHLTANEHLVVGYLFIRPQT